MGSANSVLSLCFNNAAAVSAFAIAEVRAVCYCIVQDWIWFHLDLPNHALWSRKTFAITLCRQAQYSDTMTVHCAVKHSALSQYSKDYCTVTVLYSKGYCTVTVHCHSTQYRTQYSSLYWHCHSTVHDCQAQFTFDMPYIFCFRHSDAAFATWTPVSPLTITTWLKPIPSAIRDYASNWYLV